MCFIIQSWITGNSKQKIAKKDIICYKVLKEDFSNPRILRGAYQYEYIWSNLDDVSTLPVVHRAEFDFSKDAFGRNAIYSGLHSFSTIKVGLTELTDVWWSHEKLHLYEVIIPAGSEYYYNSKNKEYVSTKLIIQTDKLIQIN